MRGTIETAVLRSFVGARTILVVALWLDRAVCQLSWQVVASSNGLLLSSSTVRFSQEGYERVEWPSRGSLNSEFDVCIRPEISSFRNIGSSAMYTSQDESGNTLGLSFKIQANAMLIKLYPP